MRDKLRRAFAAEKARREGEGPGGDRQRGLSELLRRHEQRRLRRERVELPEGCEQEGEHGPFWVRRLEYGLDDRHGERRLGEAFDVDWQRIEAVARMGALDVRLQELLFVDTETTGLAGGAGTVVFLTGIGFFEDDRFVLEQMFLRSFAEEPGALGHFAARLRQRPWQVSFVGKSFDRHRLAARMAVHKVKGAVLGETHLDLYYLARRRWGKELPDCRLRTVEERRLGVVREDDLPGSEAPMAFLDWVRDGTGAVDRVMEHNRLDVLSLVTLLTALG